MAAQTHFINVFIVFSCHYSSPDFLGGSLENASAIGKISAIHSEVDCVNEPFAHGLTLREEGQIEFLGKTPNGLSASATLPAADGQCQYYCGKLPNPIAQDSAGTFLSGSQFKVHCSAFFSPCSPWRFFVDDGRSREHNRDRIRFNQSTGSVSIRPDTSRPTVTAIGYAEFYSPSHDAVIRVYDAAGNVIEGHERNGISKSASSDVRNTPDVQSMCLFRRCETGSNRLICQVREPDVAKTGRGGCTCLRGART
jgi:hypothetical protein